MTEADIQISLVEYLNLVKNQFGFLFFSTSNEAMGKATSRGGIARMMKLRKMGMRHGVADLVFVKDGKVFFLEMKRPKGVQSDYQKEFEADAMKNGAPYDLAYSFDQAIEVLKNWEIIT